MHAAGPDERLIRLAAGRQEWALAELYDRHHAVALGLATRILGDESAAKDAVQRAFVVVWRCAGTYDSRGATVRAWILATVHREAMAALRGPTVADTSGDDATTAGEPPVVWGGPFGSLEPSVVSRALDGLPPAQRGAILSAYLDGLVGDDLAERSGTAISDLGEVLRSGLRSLTEALRVEARGA
jgi:RNA polymerase sigma-70 factor (ECF subfamily)